MAMTLRLSEEENKALAELQEVMKCKTASSALKMMIKDHGQLLENLRLVTEQKEQAKNDLARMKTEMRTYFHTAKNLQSMISEE